MSSLELRECDIGGGVIVSTTYNNLSLLLELVVENDR